MKNLDVFKEMKKKGIIKSNDMLHSSYKRVLAREKTLSEQILAITSFVRGDLLDAVRERTYCIKNNIKEPIKCTCGNNVEFSLTMNRYKKYCSKRCEMVGAKQLREETLLIKYGVDHNSRM